MPQTQLAAFEVVGAKQMSQTQLAAFEVVGAKQMPQTQLAAFEVVGANVQTNKILCCRITDCHASSLVYVPLVPEADTEV